MGDEVCMRRCLDLARIGEGRVSPNPMVGSLIINSGMVIGEGFHAKAGEPHAEVMAVRSVKNPDLLKDSVLYVNLEPCSHVGRTPACSRLLIETGILEVVIAHQDPFSQVNGEGIRMLREAGIKVTMGVLEAEARELNRRFITFHQHKRPYIILKWAKTRDGFMDIDRQTPGSNQDNWISGPELRSMVHQWRSSEDAILVGTHTAINDNPRLNVRNWAGKDPLRLVIDEHGILSPSLHLFDQTQKTIVYTAVPKPSLPMLSYVRLDFSRDILPELMNDLYHRSVQSLIVEGGRELLDHFIRAGLWDEARILTGNKYFYKGLKAPGISGSVLESFTTGCDFVEIIRNQHGYVPGI